MDPDALNDFGKVELNTAERRSLSALNRNKDFAVLCDVIARLMAQRGMDMQRQAFDGQDFVLIRNQGAYQLFKKILEVVDGAKNDELDLSLDTQ